jgi:hypothetical protein
MLANANTDDLGEAFHSLVQAFQRIGNRYEDVGAEVSAATSRFSDRAHANVQTPPLTAS